jgi:outer membrane protein assembly factor BamD (BamD/ComL family)
MTRAGVVLLVATALGAPFQCPSEPDPSRAREETPGEALYTLAQEFHQAGDRDGWERTLQHLIRRYPASRFAVTARRDLEDAGIEVSEDEPSKTAEAQ